MTFRSIQQQIDAARNAASPLESIAGKPARATFGFNKAREELERWQKSVAEKTGAEAIKSVNEMDDAFANGINKVTGTIRERLDYLNNEIAQLKSQQNRMQSANAIARAGSR